MNKLCASRVMGSVAVALAVLSATAGAKADVSSWMYAGFGRGFLDAGKSRERWTVQLDAGIGTPPAAFVFGGILRLQPYFTEGTDMALLARGATRGFVQGGWGFALDAGGYERLWGQRSQGGVGSVVLGAPWGVTLSASGGLGTHDHRFATLTLGIDFARLTVYRTTGTQWFMNPFATDERGRGPR